MVPQYIILNNYNIHDVLKVSSLNFGTDSLVGSALTYSTTGVPSSDPNSRTFPDPALRFLSALIHPIP